MPIYVVTIRAAAKESEVAVQTRLIEAKNQAQALAHACKAHITIDKAASADLIECTKAGIEVEVAA